MDEEDGGPEDAGRKQKQIFRKGVDILIFCGKWTITIFLSGDMDDGESDGEEEEETAEPMEEDVEDNQQEVSKSDISEHLYKSNTKLQPQVLTSPVPYLVLYLHWAQVE